MHSSISYVVASINMSQHSFSATSASWCRDPSFHVGTASLFRLCCNTVLYYPHFCRDPKSRLRQRLVATELDFLSQLRSHVATWFLGVVNILCRDMVWHVATQFSCPDQTLLCSTYSFCRDPVCCVTTELLCIVLNSLSRHIKVCCDLVSLCSA